MRGNRQNRRHARPRAVLPKCLVGLVLCLGLGCEPSHELLSPVLNYLPVRLIHASEIERLTKEIASHEEALADGVTKEEDFLEQLRAHQEEIANWDERIKQGDPTAAASKDKILEEQELLFARYRTCLNQNDDYRRAIGRWKEEKQMLTDNTFPLRYASVGDNRHAFPDEAASHYELPLDLNEQSLALTLETPAGDFALHVSYGVERTIVYGDEVTLRTVFKKSLHHSFDSIQVRCPTKGPCYTHDMLLSLYF